MRAYVKLTIGILLVALAIIGANFFIPHKGGSSSVSMKEVYLIIAVLGLSFLAGFYLVYKSLKEINSHQS